MPDQNSHAEIQTLIRTLNENPSLWETRKKIAELFYAEKEYLEATDIIWGAPELPTSDDGMAFVLKILSRAKPNRSIRLIYEIVRRNQNKPYKNLGMAKSLNNIGMHMEAARFYGAALASDSSLFDLRFERQMLWLDHSERLLEEWKKSDQDSKPPLNVPQQVITDEAILPKTLVEDPLDESIPKQQPQQSSTESPVSNEQPFQPLQFAPFTPEPPIPS